MAVSIKSAREIELMREAGKRLAHVHQELEAMIAPGISTWEIDAKGEKLIRDCGCIPNFLHYNGYPASICVSVNDEVVHGIPRKDRYLKEGDIVSLDAGLTYKGYHSDAARTHAVGKVSTEAQKLMDVTKQSFFEGIKMAKEGQHCISPKLVAILCPSRSPAKRYRISVECSPAFWSARCRASRCRLLSASSQLSQPNRSSSPAKSNSSPSGPCFSRLPTTEALERI